MGLHFRDGGESEVFYHIANSVTEYALTGLSQSFSTVANRFVISYGRMMILSSSFSVFSYVLDIHNASGRKIQWKICGYKANTAASQPAMGFVPNLTLHCFFWKMPLNRVF